MDAQFTRTQRFPFAVPQRRRRVFVVGYLGDWRRAAEVLLEPECSCWHTPSRFRAREILAGTSGKDLALADGKLRLTGQSGTDRHWDASGGTIGASNQELFSQNFNGLVTSLGESGKGFYNEQASAQTLEAHEDQHRRNIVFWNNNDYAEALTCTSDRQFMPDKARLQCVIEERDVAATLTAAYADKMGLENQHGVGAQEELAYTQNATGVMGVCTKGIASTVRRLLPVECERLMGFPDNHTKIAWKGKSADECPDSPRYKCCGNSMAIPCMQWVGERIQMVEEKYNNVQQQTL